MAFSRQVMQFERIVRAGTSAEAKKKWAVLLVAYTISSDAETGAREQFYKLVHHYINLSKRTKEEIDEIYDQINAASLEKGIKLPGDFYFEKGKIYKNYENSYLSEEFKKNEDFSKKLNTSYFALLPSREAYFREKSRKNEEQLDSTTLIYLHYLLQDQYFNPLYKSDQDCLKKFNEWWADLESEAKILIAHRCYHEAKSIYRDWLIPKAEKLLLNRDVLSQVLNAEADICDYCEGLMEFSAGQVMLPWKEWRTLMEDAQTDLKKDAINFLEQSSLDPQSFLVSQQKYNDVITQLVKEIIEYCIKKMRVNPPTDFVLLGLGSIARKGLLSGSDLECAFLLKNAKSLEETVPESNRKNQQYFFILIRLINACLCVIDKWFQVDDAFISGVRELWYVKDINGYSRDYRELSQEIIGAKDAFEIYHTFQTPVCLYAYNEQSKKLYEAYIRDLSGGRAANRLSYVQLFQLQYMRYSETKQSEISIKGCYLGPLIYWCLTFGLYHGVVDQGITVSELLKKLVATRKMQQLTADKIETSLAFLSALRVVETTPKNNEEKSVFVDNHEEKLVAVDNHIQYLYQSLKQSFSPDDYESEQKKWQVTLGHLVDSVPRQEESKGGDLRVRWATYQDGKAEPRSGLLKRKIQAEWEQKQWIDKRGLFQDKAREDNQQHGRGIVIPFHERQQVIAYGKIYPEYPRIQSFAETLAWAISGYGPVSTLCRLGKINQKKSPVYPILFSKPAGTVLQNVIQRPSEFEYIVSHLDDYSFTMKVIESLLICYEDDKFDNVAAEWFFNAQGEERCRLISFDCDRSFVTPLFIQYKQDVNSIRQAKVNAKSIIYSLDKMQEPLHQGAVEDFCKRDVYQLLFDWLQKHTALDDAYFSPPNSANDRKKYYSELKEQDKSFLHPAFIPGTVKELYQKLYRMQHILQGRESSSGTHFELLQIFEPGLAIRYERAWKASPINAVERFLKLETNYEIIRTIGNNAQVSITQRTARHTFTSTFLPKSSYENILEAIIYKAFVTPVRAQKDELEPIHDHYSSIERVLSTLKTGGFELFAPLKEDDYLKECILNKLNFGEIRLPAGKLIAFQKQILSHVAGTLFKRLNLRNCNALAIRYFSSYFYYVRRFLKSDNLLENCSELYSLSLSQCSGLLEEAMKNVEYYCISLAQLELQHLVKFNKLQALEFLHLRSLKIDHLENLSLVDIRAPQLQRLHIFSCNKLEEVKTDSRRLERVVVTNCRSIYNKGLGELARDHRQLKVVELKECPGVSTPTFWESYPWLIDYISWFSLEFVEKLGQEMNRLCDKYGIDSKQMVFNERWRSQLRSLFQDKLVLPRCMRWYVSSVLISQSEKENYLDRWREIDKMLPLVDTTLFPSQEFKQYPVELIQTEKLNRLTYILQLLMSRLIRESNVYHRKELVINGLSIDNLEQTNAIVILMLFEIEKDDDVKIELVKILSKLGIKGWANYFIIFNYLKKQLRIAEQEVWEMMKNGFEEEKKGNSREQIRVALTETLCTLVQTNRSLLAEFLLERWKIENNEYTNVKLISAIDGMVRDNAELVVEFLLEQLRMKEDWLFKKDTIKLFMCDLWEKDFFESLHKLINQFSRARASASPDTFFSSTNLNQVNTISEEKRSSPDSIHFANSGLN